MPFVGDATHECTCVCCARTCIGDPLAQCSIHACPLAPVSPFGGHAVHLLLLHRELAGIHDDDLLGRCAGLGADRLDLLDDVHTVDDDAEHDVLAIEPRSLDGAEEELGAVGSGASVGHGKDTRAGVLELEVLIGELGPVDRLAAGARAVGEVAALDHEVGDDAVEGGALVVEGLARGARALLARAEGAEVLDGLRDGLTVKAHDDAARGLATCTIHIHQ